MRNKLSLPFLRLWCVLISIILSISVQAEIDQNRLKLRQLSDEGNWKDALDLAQQNLSTVSDDYSDTELELAVRCMRKLQQYDSFEKILGIVQKSHANNPQTLLQAAKELSSIPNHGAWIDNEFVRAANPYNRRNSRGEYAYSRKRDRVRALQLLEKAYTLTEDVNIKVNILRQWASTIQRSRAYNNSWKLQSLTDTTTLPEIQRGYISHSSSKGAPATADGAPLFYEIPESYAVAKNDGERWRWLLAERVKISAMEKRQVYGELAAFLHQQFGVQSFSWYHMMRGKDAEANQSGIMQVHTLKDNETIARLANDVKRFELPDEQNFIHYYKENWKAGDAAAGDRLVNIYLDRRQYDKATELLKKILLTKGDTSQKHRKKLLAQITEDWGRFEGQGSPFTPQSEKKISLIYRNAKQVTLTLHEMNMQALNDDIWEYLQSNPRKLDWNKTNWSNLLQSSVNGKHNQYVGKQISREVYTLKPRPNYWDTRATLTLPKINKAGAYLLRGEMTGGKKFYTMVWIDDMILTSRHVDGGTLYFAADAETGEPIAGAELIVRGYKTVALKKKTLLRKHDVVTTSFRVMTDESGQVLISNRTKNPQHYNWTVEARKGEKRAWSGNRRIRSWHKDNLGSYKTRKSFCMTSQPVYKPNSTVQGKFWVRDVSYDLGDISRYAGRTIHLSIRDPRGQRFGKGQTIVADAYGGVAFTAKIPEDAILGRYTVQINFDTENGSYAGNGNFRIEKYKKPEYQVTVEAPTIPVQLGDEFKATIKANYYHGAPVTNAAVKVKVLRHKHNARWFPYGKWDWLYGAGYGWLDVERSWYPGWYEWGCRCPLPFWYGRNYQQPELIIDEEMKIGKDGTLEVKINTSLAKMIHGNDDHRYEIKVEVIDASRRTIFGSGSVLATRNPFQVTTWLNKGYAKVGDKIQASIAANTLDNRKVKGWIKTKLYNISSDKNGKIKEQLMREWDRARFSEDVQLLDFKVNTAGQYRLSSTVTDGKGRQMEGAVLFSVRGADDAEGGFSYNDLELIPDKRTYAPDEPVKLLINTKRKDSTVLVFVRGTKDRRLLKLSGNSQVIEIPVTLADMPNFFIEVMTISNGRVHSQVKEIIVPPAQRTLNVEVTPNSEKYKPQQKGSVKIKVTDEHGNPVTGECVLAIYDKSLEYISGGSNVAEIKSFFWKWKRHFQRGYWNRSMAISGGNVVKKNQSSMSDLGAFGHQLALDFGDADNFGDGWGAGRSNGFSSRSDSFSLKGKALTAPSLSMAEVVSANAVTEDEVAANQPEAVNVTIRKDFADLIKWSGSVRLNKDGIAEVPVEYPDNLTTWKIQTWAMAHGTRVGQGSAEVITSKDLIIRLQAPRFFVEKDEVTLNAIVHNYHEKEANAKVSLELEGGTLKVIEGERTQEVALAAKNGEKRVNWNVKVTQEGEAVIRMKVITADDADAMEMKFPVYVHGMLKQMAWSKEIEPDAKSTQIIIDVPAERRPEDSRLEVRFSPTIAGAIVDALPYLAEYPYGCTEQTLNRFVPTVIAQKILKDMGIDLEEVRNKRTNLNPQELGNDKERAKRWKTWQRNPVFNEKEVNKMVRQGVDRLIEMQLSDGGWGWFSGYGEKSYPHTTAVVVHGLLLAQKNAANIPKNRLKIGVQWLKRYEERETEKIRMWDKRERNTKQKPSTIDCFVRVVLAEYGLSNKEMLDYQFRHKNSFGVYAKCMLGISLHLATDTQRCDALIRNIEQFLVYDKENQSAFLEMRNQGYWWNWYGNEIEAHAWYLKLLTAVKPESKQARGVVKYLINNRTHATYWNSTRDTAFCIEAIAGYMQASGENDPNAEVEILFNGKSFKKVTISKENLFSYDNKMTLAGDVLTTGKHVVEIRRKGTSPLYTNAYLTVFTKEDYIKKAGIEVKVARKFYKLVPKKATNEAAGRHGQVVNQKTDQYQRIPLKLGDSILSGDIIEVELLLESKNDYEYLLFADYKAAGTEAEKVRSGYMNTGSMHAYMEVHDEKVCFFIRQLPRGKHSLTYKLRSEIPGKFSALPATASAMYAPELRANSDEMKLKIHDKQ